MLCGSKPQNICPFLSLIPALLVLGEDYTIASPLSLTFNSSTTNGDSVCLRIGIIDDDIYEEEQTFVVSITDVSPPSVAVLGSSSSITQTIQDNNGLLIDAACMEASLRALYVLFFRCTSSFYDGIAHCQ